MASPKTTTAHEPGVQAGESRVELASEANRSDASRTANRYLKRVKYGNRISHLVQPDLSAMEWLFELVIDYGDHSGELPAIAPDRAARSVLGVARWLRGPHVPARPAHPDVSSLVELGSSPRLVRSLELDYDDFA